MTKRKIWMQAAGATLGVVLALGIYYMPTFNKASDEAVYYSIEGEPQEAGPAPPPPAADGTVGGDYEIRSLPTEPPLQAPTWPEIFRSFAYQGIPYFLGIIQAVIGLITAKRLKKAKEKDE